MQNLTYKSGFLEHALASGSAFINAPERNPIAMIKLAGPAEIIANATISFINIQLAGVGPKFKCEVIANGQVLFNHETFNLNGNEYEDVVYIAAESEAATRFVHGFVKNDNNCYLTYSVKVDQSYQSPPKEAASAAQIYRLSLFSLEPCVGDNVFVSIKNGDELNALNYDVASAKLRTVSFVEGSNYELSTNTALVPNFIFATNPGGGTGRVPCALNDFGGIAGDYIPAPYVTGINNVPPNALGNFTFSSETNSCLTVSGLAAQNKIEIDAHCAPCCRCTDYAEVQKYIRSYAVLYVNLAQEFNRLVAEYNSINAAFQNKLECCDSFDKVNPRIRVWPQQNFRVLVQALAENNKKVKVCLCEVELDLKVKNEFEQTAVEEITTLAGDTVSITHTLPADQSLIITPLKEGAYVYFKSVNPGNKLDITTPETGQITTVTTISDLDIVLPCVASEESSTCMDPCSGYFMLTSGLSIVDPTFRKIANIKQEEIPVKIDVKFRYKGTATDPCAPCTWRPPIYNRTKQVKMAPNRKSINACAGIKLKDISKVTPEDPTQPEQYYVNFPEAVTVKAGGSLLTISRKVYNGETQQYDPIGTDEQITIPEGEVTNIAIPSPFPSNIPASSLGLIMTVTSSGENMITYCQPNPNSSDTVEIPVSPSSVGVSFTL